MYIAAGLYTILKYVKSDVEDRLLKSITPNGLISYGLGLERRSSKKKFSAESYFKQMDNFLDTTVGKEFFDKLYWLLDSGGYQVSIGLLPKHSIEEYIEAYHLYLERRHKNFDEAFTLDLPISAKFFNDFELAYKVNKLSYERSTQLTQEVLDKMMFVSHFRTINNFELYNKLIYEDNLIQHFKRFSIGGLVVGQQGINKIPINLYTVGFLQILLYFVHKDNKPNSIRFHILGASDHKSVIFFHLLKLASKHFYNIDLELSFDSSSMFKKFQRARFFTYFDPHTGLSRLISAKERDLHKIEPTFGITNLQLILNEIEHMYREIGVDFDTGKYTQTIYDGDTFYDELRFPLTLLEAYQIKKFDKYCQEIAPYLFEIFIKDPDMFRNEMVDFLVKLHKKGNLTDAVKQQANTYTTSLLSISEFNSIDDLTRFMYSYNTVTDSEHMEAAPVWEI